MCSCTCTVHQNDARLHYVYNVQLLISSTLPLRPIDRLRYQRHMSWDWYYTSTNQCEFKRHDYCCIWLYSRDFSFSKSLKHILEFVTWDLTGGWTKFHQLGNSMRMFKQYHVLLYTCRRVWFLHCLHCNDFAAIIFNKNLLKKLWIPLFSPLIIWLEGVAVG